MTFYLRAALFIIYSGLFTSHAFGQYDITGKVFDGETGEGLPSATILLEGTYRGTITNQAGDFNLSIEQLPAVIHIRYIGYETVRIEINDLTVSPLVVYLNSSIAELGEITVTEKDPGLSIMELVIERKKLWRNLLTSYKVDAYTRQILSNDTSIVSITESSSTAYWNEAKGHKEIQTSRTQTSNISESENFAGVSYMPNFYDDDILIAGYNIVGITHPDATRYYRFRLLETSQMDGKPLYRIEVTPRRTRQPLFEGEAWVLGRDYALLEVDLKPNDVVSFPPPIQDFNLSYSQQFSNYGGDFWLPVDMRIEGLIRIVMVGLRFPPINFRQVSRLSDYEINVAIPDSVYRESNRIVRSEHVETDSSVIIREPIPLTELEQLAYETIDSTQTLDEAFRPEGFLARMIETSEESDQNGYFLGIGRVVPNGMSPLWRYNRIEGHHLGLKYSKHLSRAGIRLDSFTGYSFHSDYWDLGLSLRKRLLSIHHTGIDLIGGYAINTSTRYDSNLYTLGMNSLNSFLGGEDYFDYYRNEQALAGLRFRRIFPRTDLTMTLQRELHTAFDTESVFDNSLFGWHDKRRENPPIEEGELRSVLFELGYNLSSQDYGFAGNRQVRLVTEFSNDFLGSDFSFGRYAISVDWNFETFYQRRLFTNTLDLHISAGTFSGELPVQRFGLIDGSMNHFSPFGSLKTRINLPYEGSEYWVATAEHNFRTIPFEVLGLKYPVEKGWGIIVFGGAGSSSVSGSYPGLPLPMVSDGIHSEIGISLNSLFGIMRIDFAKRLDRPGSFIGFSVPRYF